MRQLALLYLVALVFLCWGFAMGKYEEFPYSYIEPIFTEIQEFVAGHPEGDDVSLKQKVSYARQEYSRFFRYSGYRRRDREFSDPGYLLISRYSKAHDQVIIELAQLSNSAGEFAVLHTWIPPIKEILSRGQRDLWTNSTAGYRAQHPLLMEDGGLVFTSGEGPLVRIDKCNKIRWMIDEHFHHSIEMSHDGHIVVPYTNDPNLQKVPDYLRDDGYAVVTTEGEIIQRYSMGKILMENGYRGLFLGVGRIEEDRFHLNDVQPIYNNAGDARIGDVAISLRHLSAVLLYRPSTNKVIWLKTGPWLNQHDINMMENGKYSIFGNDVYRLEEEGQTMAQQHSEVYFYEPASNQVTTPYTKALKATRMTTPTSGRSRVLANGDVYIEESDRHRLLRVSPDKVRWEYVNSATKKTTGALNWSRYLTAEEVDTGWINQECGQQ